MKKKFLQTPATFVDKNIMLTNLRNIQKKADECGKQLWPMIKTHKSLGIARMQYDLGATGFLAGTLDECEALCEEGYENIMYAYPVADEPGCRRVVSLAKKCNFIIRLDTFEGAMRLNEHARKAGIKVQYTIILNSGGNRFGYTAGEITAFAERLKPFSQLVFMGISTHPGHIYTCKDPKELYKYIEDEKTAIKEAVEKLTAAGYDLKIVSTGSTPAFEGETRMEYVNILHPGVYVFNDCLQSSISGIPYESCALYIYTTVISSPKQGLYICDAGSKCIGLDKGAHGNSLMDTYGYIKEHDELELFSLSEEVGKIRVKAGKSTNIKVGDRLEIIPNHACSAANLTGCYFVTEGENITNVIKNDMRSNSTLKNYYV